MKTKIILLLTALALAGCTTRGGWPRFLRHGEMSDREMRQWEQAHARTNAPARLK